MLVTSSLHAKLTVISGEKVNANILTIRVQAYLADLQLAYKMLRDPVW